MLPGVAAVLLAVQLGGTIALVGDTTPAPAPVVAGDQFAWSPHGRLIAFEAQPTPHDYEHVWAVRPDGTYLRDLGIGFARPAWSPDGSRIVFRGLGGLVVVRVKTGRSRQLTTEDPRSVSGDADARWSPDGRWIAFLSQKHGELFDELWAIRADGTGLHRVAYGVTDPPSWSPTGLLLYSSAGRYDVHNTGLPVWGLYVTRPLGGARAIHPGATSDAEWSPDGRWIAYAATFENSLHVVRADGSDDRTLFQGGGFEKTWAPDSRHLAVGSSTGTWIVDLAGNTTLLTPQTFGRLAWRPYARSG